MLQFGNVEELVKKAEASTSISNLMEKTEPFTPTARYNSQQAVFAQRGSLQNLMEKTEPFTPTARYNSQQAVFAQYSTEPDRRCCVLSGPPCMSIIMVILTEEGVMVQWVKRFNEMISRES